MSTLSSETVHATCVAIDGRGVLLAGRSDSGKSDLALRLLDRGATLVADDYTLLTRRRDGRLWATAPATIAGRIEVRGVGIVERAAADGAEVALILDLDAPVARLPEAAARHLAGVPVPCAALAPFEASAPIKVALLLEACTR